MKKQPDLNLWEFIIMNGSYNIYTVANDNMIGYLETFCNSLMRINENLIKNLNIIPFNNDISKTKEFCDRHKIKIIEPDPVWDLIGKKIYGDEEYRVGIKSFNYFRKLNSFSDSCKKFIFFDLNSILLDDFDSVFDTLENSNKDTIFMTRSAKGRTIRKEYFQLFSNDLIPGIRTGYNAGFFVSNPNVIDKNLALSIAQKNLRKLFGKAPEQAFIAYYFSIFNKKAAKLSEVNSNYQDGFWPNKYKIINENKSYYYIDENGNKNKMFIVKNTGQDIESLKDSINYDIFSDFLKGKN